jgi:NTP pyrophosphatase (non-canonical NTP hydrolase)
MNHRELVQSLIKPGRYIQGNITPIDCELIHATMGICGEAGELLDAIKKSTIYSQPLDRNNIIEELGDLEFYMEALRQTLELSREETLTANIVKLSRRYPDLCYNDEHARKRLDKE